MTSVSIVFTTCKANTFSSSLAPSLTWLPSAEHSSYTRQCCSTTRRQSNHRTISLTYTIHTLLVRHTDKPFSLDVHCRYHLLVCNQTNYLLGCLREGFLTATWSMWLCLQLATLSILTVQKREEDLSVPWTILQPKLHTSSCMHLLPWHVRFLLELIP